MKTTNDVDALCLEAFGRISATVTHEIKNTLSIINESAGYLSDLALMVGEDGGVPSQKVADATTTIEKQVARSNTIMKNLNRFAHSGDEPVSMAKLSEVLQLMLDLTSRQAASASVTVKLQCADEIAITGSLLTFEALLFYVLDSYYTDADAGTNISIEAKTVSSKIQLFFAKEGDTQGVAHSIHGEKIDTLTQSLNATSASNYSTFTIPLNCSEQEG